MDDGEDYSLYPGILGVLAHAGFRDDAVKLAAAWGGTKHYVPPKPTQNSLICGVISQEAAKILAEVYGGTHCDIPRMRFGSGGPLWEIKKKIFEYDGVSTSEVAKKVGCTARYVRMVRANHLENCQQKPK